MRRFLLGLLLVSLPALGGEWAPTVYYRQGRVTGRPAGIHQATKQRMRVLEKQACTHGAPSGNGLSVPGSCTYLRGLYQYDYKDGHGDPHRTFSEFSIFRKGSGYVFLEAVPLDITLRPKRPGLSRPTLRSQ